MKEGTIVASKQPNTLMSLASITKIFTSGLAYETFLKTHDMHDSETRAFLTDIQNMMSASDNQAAEIISHTFGNTEEEILKNLNAYTSTYNLIFKNVTGLDITENGVIVGAGGQGKTVDLVRGIANIYTKYPEIFDKTIIADPENTNLIAGKLDFFVAGKTGFTDYSGGNLAVIVQKGIDHKYLILVLGSTENGRFVDVETIAKALLQLGV
jgi:D-alanyl-D-alanine carboxypeptidase